MILICVWLWPGYKIGQNLCLLTVGEALLINSKQRQIYLTETMSFWAPDSTGVITINMITLLSSILSSKPEQPETLISLDE
jgi:hypothetical protein